LNDYEVSELDIKLCLIKSVVMKGDVGEETVKKWFTRFQVPVWNISCLQWRKKKVP
jgi:hypothetical protein